MHGRPRPKPDAAQDPEVIRKQKQKALLYGKLSAEVLGRRAAGRHDPESLALSAKLLELNPEVYTVWNYRREALAQVLQNPSSEAAREAVQRELALTQKALGANPKSYAAWHHRGWIVVKGGADLQAELLLVKRLLQLDDRNFHGWAYWRWLVARAQTPPEDCLEYTMKVLRANFSNYSAWHARTALLAAAHAPPATPTLQQLLAGAGSSMPEPQRVPLDVLDREFDLVHKAFWTEPRDQSAWLYHRWLLGSCLAAAADSAPSNAVTLDSGGGGGDGGGSGGAASASPDARAALQGRLAAEAAMCTELLQEEPEAKWPLLTLTRVQEALTSLAEASNDAAFKPLSVGPHQSASTGTGTANATGGQTAEPAQAESAYERLSALDPLRSGYYADAAAGRAHVVLRPSMLSGAAHT